MKSKDVLPARMKAPVEYRNGPMVKFYPNGTVEKEYYLNDGLFQGVVTLYHPNGRVKYKGFYVDDKVHGVYKHWDETGRLECVIHMSQGQKHGSCRHWFADGWQVINWYDQGQLISSRRITPRNADDSPQEMP